MQVNIHFLTKQFKASKNNQHVSPRPFRPPSRHEHEHVHYEEDFERPHERKSPHQRRKRRPPPPKEVRINLPPFHGKDNVETYLDWVAKVDQLFDSHMIEEDIRVCLVVLSFQGHALNWWTSLVLQKRRKRQPEIDYWFDLKAVLNAHHIPSYYKRELMDKLQRLQQRSITVEEYKQKMELYTLRAGIEEEGDLTIVSFLITI